MRRFCVALTLTGLGALCGCAAPPPSSSALDLSLSHVSEQRKFIVTLQPQAAPLPVNRIHSWEIRLTDATGAPVEKASIFIGGGMPEHGHGFPTLPRVTRETAPGVYLLEGMKFNMHGRWELKLGIQAGGVFDIATFNTIVPLPAVAQ